MIVSLHRKTIEGKIKILGIINFATAFSFRNILFSFLIQQ
jgi:hypothetical protein